VKFPWISQTPSVNFPWNLAHFKNPTVKSRIFFPWIRLVPSNNTAIVCDTWPVRRQTYGCLPSLRWYQITTAWSQRYTCVWTACPGLHLAVGSQTCDLFIAGPIPYHYSISSSTFDSGNGIRPVMPKGSVEAWLGPGLIICRKTGCGGRWQGWHCWLADRKGIQPVKCSLSLAPTEPANPGSPGKIRKNGERDGW